MRIIMETSYHLQAWMSRIFAFVRDLSTVLPLFLVCLCCLLGGTETPRRFRSLFHMGFVSVDSSDTSFTLQYWYCHLLVGLRRLLPRLLLRPNSARTRAENRGSIAQVLAVNIPWLTLPASSAILHHAILLLTAVDICIVTMLAALIAPGIKSPNIQERSVHGWLIRGLSCSHDGTTPRSARS